MDASFPQALFASYGMTSVFFAVIIIELISVIYFLVTTAEFRMIRRRHEKFFREIGGHNTKELVRTSSVIFLIYLTTTVIITAVTLALFLFQPHLI